MPQGAAMPFRHTVVRVVPESFVGVRRRDLIRGARVAAEAKP